MPVSLQNAYVEVLNFSVSIFGDGTTLEESKLNGVNSVGPDPIGLVSLYEETPKNLLSLSPQASMEERPGEDTVRRQPSTSQEESLHQKSNQPELDLRLLASRTVRNLFFVV